MKSPEPPAKILIFVRARSQNHARELAKKRLTQALGVLWVHKNIDVRTIYASEQTVYIGEVL